ncbi:hypothetical protein BSTAB16_2201 [Burkholderia stabilis]|uniref:Uncharacterized protein n=1 Tax=Burkholderia stabilis TaxID=95485 RepID=A0AAJ5N9X7_9BURK|nr:hypothetical protein BSTAB16_2201 [Burkholderia stabilis]
MSNDATARAWQLNDVSVYLTAANASNDAPHDGPDSKACLDVLQPLLGRHAPAPGVASHSQGGHLEERPAARRQLRLTFARINQRQHLVGLLQRVRSVRTKLRAPVRRLPRSAERGRLRRVRLMSLWRTPYVRRRRRTGMRRSIVDVCQTLPGDARNDSRPRPEHDAPVSAGRALRARRFEYRVHGAIDRCRCGRHKLRVSGRRARLLRQYRLFAHRGNLRVLRR